MDKVLADTLTANLKSAKTDKELQKAHTLAMIAVVDCQCRTGMRVKRQGLILCGIGILLLVALLCGSESATKLLCFLEERRVMKTKWASCCAPIIRHAIADLGEKDSVLMEDWRVEVCGFRFVVPAGTSTDGASIPRFLWRVCGHPLESPRLYAALLHDWLYGGCGLPVNAVASRVHDARYTGVTWITVETLEGDEVDPSTITRSMADDCYYHLLRHFKISSFCAHVEWAALRLFGGSHWSEDAHNPDGEEDDGAVV